MSDVENVEHVESDGEKGDHSRKPKHYLEVLPKLVQLGRVKLILATSSLSAGIDLPVRFVIFAAGLAGERARARTRTSKIHSMAGGFFIGDASHAGT